MDRREFLKKAGLVGGLGAAGAVTMKKEYIKPVIRALEPNYAGAVTPVLNVVASMPSGSSVKVGATTTFVFAIWGINVSGLAAVKIPAGVKVNVKYLYTFLSDDGVVTKAALQTGTETKDIKDVFKTTEGEFRLTVAAKAVTDTHTITDGAANACTITTALYPKLEDALWETQAAVSTTGDAFILAITPTVQATTLLGIAIPETELDTITLTLTGKA